MADLRSTARSRLMYMPVIIVQMIPAYLGAVATSAQLRRSESEACVEASVLNRFGDVLRRYGSNPGEIGDRACDAQDPMVGAGRQQQAGKRMTQQLVAFAIRCAMTVDLARSEQRVGFALADKLHLTSVRNAVTNVARAFG